MQTAMASEMNWGANGRGCGVQTWFCRQWRGLGGLEEKSDNLKAVPLGRT